MKWVTSTHHPGAAAGEKYGGGINTNTFFFLPCFREEQRRFNCNFLCEGNREMEEYCIPLYTSIKMWVNGFHTYVHVSLSWCFFFVCLAYLERLLSSNKRSESMLFGSSFGIGLRGCYASLDRAPMAPPRPFTSLHTCTHSAGILNTCSGPQNVDEPPVYSHLRQHIAPPLSRIGMGFRLNTPPASLRPEL